MKFLLALAIALTIPVGSSCRQTKEAVAVIERAKVPAFNGAVSAFVLLDDYAARRIDAVASPTEDQLVAMRRDVERLKLARDALAELKEWLEGNNAVDGMGKLREAVDLMDLVARGLKNEGVTLPAEVENGLSRARTVL